MGQSSFFAMLFRMKYINRWGLMRNTRWENLSEHSLETAMLAHILAVIGNRRLNRQYPLEHIVLHALYHDCSEFSPAICPRLSNMITRRCTAPTRMWSAPPGDRLASLLPSDLRDDVAPYLSGDRLDADSRRLVKAADRLSALIKCIEEEKAGNREFSQAKKATESALSAMNMPEVSIFLSEFLPAFSLTLDELEPRSKEVKA